MKKFSLIFITAFLTVSATYKTRHIFIADELAQAKTIQAIVVQGYTGKTMQYTAPGSAEILSVDCKTRNDTFLRFIKTQKGFEGDYAGQWPQAGDEVLMVQDSTNRVVLFAAVMGSDYRFWDPNSAPFSNSMFCFKVPFAPLEACNDNATHFNGYSMCDDGCLLPISELIER